VPLLTGARKPSSRWLVPALALVAASFAAVPAFGFSGGITKDNAGVAEFEQFGCASSGCHGTAHTFPSLDTGNVRVRVTDADGQTLNGAYEAGAIYTISITLDEQNAPGASNHAGFNLRVSAGTLSGVDGQSQASGDGTQATHVSAARTSWNVTWEAPASGAAGFSLFVNDVDGSLAPDVGDDVYWLQFGFGDHEGAVLGAVEEHEVHFGISLQQYWIGLIGLAGMLFVVVASFVYIKFVNPHNTDHKDR
jgi:hypothetical protein